MKHLSNNPLSSKYRSHTCEQLRITDVGSNVRLSGWILRKRDHGGVVFIDLRDNYGVTQLVLSGDVAAKVQGYRPETVIQIDGSVVARSAELKNSKLPSGEVEVQVSAVELLSAADLLPFQIAEDDNAPENTRLKYRFLELRREKLHRNILLRSKVIQSIREIMHGLSFHEFQTPILTSSSPEGARDFIVPSRQHPGKFYALPQAPQQFKQLLMVSGFDRYFQIAPCFRDEDARADRSPGEFYQLDIECSYVEQEDIFALGEKVFVDLFTRYASFGVETPRAVTAAPFPRIPYLEALESFGVDKPDLRNSLRIVDCSDVFAKTQFKVFRNTLDSGGRVRVIKVDVETIPSRKYFDDAVGFFTEASGQGIAYLSTEGTEWKGSIAKFVSPEEAEALKQKFSVSKPCLLFIAAGPDKVINAPLSKMISKLGADFNKIEKNAFRFCWVTDFPFFERDPETGEIVFSHNPFSMPVGGLEALNTQDPLTIKAYQYDIVCNGYELSSGAIRNHLPELMYRAFEIVGYKKEFVDEKFGGMVRAFKFGAPPHGGFAPGIDRMVMLLAGEETIREVIAFPLAQNGEDLLMSAPSSVSTKQLRDAHIEIKLPPNFKTATAANG